VRGSFQSHRGYWRGSYRSRDHRVSRGKGRGRGRGKNYYDKYDEDSYDYQEQEQEQEREQEQEEERYSRKVLVTKKKEGKKADDAALLEKADAASKEG